MSHIANLRAYLEASRTLALSTQRTEDMVLTVCETLSAVLTDMADEPVFIIPMSADEARAFIKQFDKTNASQPSLDEVTGAGKGEGDA